MVYTMSTMSIAFHLCQRKAKRILQIYANEMVFSFCAELIYFVVAMGQSPYLLLASLVTEKKLSAKFLSDVFAQQRTDGVRHLPQSDIAEQMNKPLTMSY